MTIRGDTAKRRWLISEIKRLKSEGLKLGKISRLLRKPYKLVERLSTL